MGRVVRLLMVTGENNNKFYNMTEDDSGNILVEYGRVDSTKQFTTYPISKWDSLYKSKTKKGYKDITYLLEDAKIAKDNKELRISDDIRVEQMVLELQRWAQNTIKANYKISADKVTPKMITVAQNIIDEILLKYKNNVSYEDLNKLLLDLYSTLPRKMGNVGDYLFKNNNKEHIMTIVDEEQKLLDTMSGQVLAKTTIDNDEINDSENLLDALGLKISYVDDIKVTSMISKMMGDSSNLMGNIYEVINLKTQENFNNCKTSKNNIQLLWHGSRNQNWYNIIQTGLLIRPSGAIHTGSMFGDGIYFANKARKSIGYTSLSGSYWVRGNDNKSYLALFSTNLGKVKDVYRHSSECYSYSKQNIKPHDSVYAHGGADLKNDEFIIYDSSQCTIKYLVEIKK